MKLYLGSCPYIYAAEQSLLTFFPGETPEACDKEPKEGDFASVKLLTGKKLATASVTISYYGRKARAFSRFGTDEPKTESERNRACQRAVRLAFYRAAVRVTGNVPVWGALTGVRPAKIAAKSILKGTAPENEVKRLEKELFLSPERAKMCVDAAMEGIKASEQLKENDVCLYVGIPFCPTRCAYCSFVSQSVEKSMSLIEPYLRALYEEIDAASKAVKEGNLNVAAVYIGGGTPTTLSAEQLSELISRLRRGFDIWDDREFTVEAGRPDTVTPEKLDALIDNGVNRISINPQTMRDGVLRAIGRRHTAEETVTAYNMARAAGFNFINMDMIAGLPADTPEGFRSSLNEILDLRPENITVHTLALKRGSAITAGGIEIPDGRAVGEMLDFALEALPDKGYSPYYLYRQKFTSGGFENVGWRLSGTECLYNICVMEELCSVVALGAGGSSKLVYPGDGRIIRAFNPKYPKEYIDAIENIKARKAVFAGKEPT